MKDEDIFKIIHLAGVCALMHAQVYLCAVRCKCMYVSVFISVHQHVCVCALVVFCKSNPLNCHSYNFFIYVELL